MAYPSIYLASTTEEIANRINKLKNDSIPLWGKMNAAQMLSHCCVPYQQILGEDTNRPNIVIRGIMQLFFKKSMTNEIPYQKSLPTGANFIRNSEYDFELEKSKLIAYVSQIQAIRPTELAKIPSALLGKLTAHEWNNLLYKHIDHHLTQFGV
ncbi:MAG: hypothetical protein RJA76_1114 [Bacteroidota bacterium]|jgi:hypothetical protein